MSHLGPGLTLIWKKNHRCSHPISPTQFVRVFFFKFYSVLKDILKRYVFVGLKCSAFVPTFQHQSVEARFPRFWSTRDMGLFSFWPTFLSQFAKPSSQLKNGHSLCGTIFHAPYMVFTSREAAKHRFMFLFFLLCILLFWPW